tara:strand:+ start:2662 stop:2895 length:234 start_codon:yes stop_codon:yes gene_type:complete
MSTTRLMGATRWKTLVVGEQLNPLPDSIISNTDQDVELDGDDGVIVTFSLIAGVIYPLRPQMLLSGAGLIGIYNAVK